MSDLHDGHERDSSPLDEAWGDMPPNPKSIPAVLPVQEVARPDTLEADAQRYLDEHPETREWALSEHYDAFVHNRWLYIGGGLTAFALSVGAIAIALHRRREHK